jgi:hypothetical protein
MYYNSLLPIVSSLTFMLAFRLVQMGRPDSCDRCEYELWSDHSLIPLSTPDLGSGQDLLR